MNTQTQIKDNNILNWIMWLSIISILIVALLQGLDVSPFWADRGPSIMAFISIIFTFSHAYKRYGIKDFLVLLIIVIIVGNFYENLSIATTFPFGAYNYTSLLGPKFIYTPLIVNIAYFQMIYIVWNLSGAILNYFDNDIKGKYIIVMPIISMFIMVMWDVTMDPLMSTLSKNWIWHKGGAFFGVPIQNYYGWYLCVFTMFLLFSIYLSKRKSVKTPNFVYKKHNWIQLILIYTSWPITYILMGYSYPNTAITAANGQVWMSQDILKTAGLIGLATMIFISVLVFIKTCVLDETKIK